jgi:hypothetical protein
MDEPITARKASEELAQQPEQNAPGDPKELDLAYAQGDFARLRTRARVLREDASQPETLRQRAGEWLERVSVDVVTYVVLGFALLLFCAIVLRYAL